MDYKEAQALTDMLGAKRAVKKLLEDETDAMAKELSEFCQLTGQDEVLGGSFRALIVPSRGIVWDAAAIERLAKKHGVRMSRLRDINHFNQIRTYVKKEAK